MKKPKDTNKVADIFELENGGRPRNMRVVVTNADTGEILYDWRTEAGILVSIEKGKWDQRAGTVEGNQQVLAWGHPAFVWYAYDQLSKMFKRGDGPFAAVLDFFRRQRDRLISNLINHDESL